MCLLVVLGSGAGMKFLTYLKVRDSTLTNIELFDLSGFLFLFGFIEEKPYNAFQVFKALGMY